MILAWQIFINERRKVERESNSIQNPLWEVFIFSTQIILPRPQKSRNIKSEEYVDMIVLNFWSGRLLQMLRTVPPRLKPNCPQHQEGHLLDLSHKEDGLGFLNKMLSPAITCQRPAEVQFPRCTCPTWVLATMWAVDGVFFWASSLSSSSWSLWSPPLSPASASKKALLELE